MRIRSQLIASASLAAVVVLALWAALAYLTVQARAGLDEQAESQQVAREVANMLSLTNEFAVYGSDRVAAQWRSHHDQLAADIARAIQRHDPPTPQLLDLQQTISHLPALFDIVVESSQQPASAFAGRRKQLMIERLLIETREVVEARQLWAQSVGERQHRDQERYTAVVLAAPGALLVILLSLACLVSRRVLKPLAAMESAMGAIRDGNLTVRCASTTLDEIGDAARAVDEMAQALQQRSAALRESEKQLRLVADGLPALMSHIDAGGRYTFVNAYIGKVLGIDPSSMLGRTMREVRGEDDYRDIAPHVERALRGETVNFEGVASLQGQVHHYQSTYVPDIDDDAQVRGFFAMTFDITALKKAQQREAHVQRQLHAIADNLPVLLSYVDKEERFAFVNATSKAWFGLDPSAAAGRKVCEVTDPRFHEERLPHIREALKGRQVSFECLALVGGAMRYLSTVYIPDIQGDGQVEGLYAISTDVTPMKEVEQRLSDMAHIDSLTGLANRRQLGLRLPEGLSRSARTGLPIALMYLDIDRFKAINDRLGHAAGDAVLKEFALRLKAVVRITDLAVRLAGDEFVVLLEAVHSEVEATMVADKIVMTMREPFHVDGESLVVTTSIGVAYCAHPTSDRALMLRADEALYAAKGAGRNGFQVHAQAAPEVAVVEASRLSTEPAA